LGAAPIGRSCLDIAGPKFVKGLGHRPDRFPTQSLEHLSKLTGQTTIIKEQVARSGRGPGTNVSTTMQEAQRPLITPDEYFRMPGPKKDAGGLIIEAGDMVVYCAGFPAIYGRQPLFFQDPTFAARAAVPPPKQQRKNAGAFGSC
jgi:type IV secretion system protein VirD4